MTWWAWLLIGVARAGLLLTIAALALLRWLHSADRSPMVRRLLALPLRTKFFLVRRLLSDRRVPLQAKVLLPVLILYLALPLDLIPDFIPVVGHVDDLLAVAVVAFLIVKATPSGAIEEHLAALEKEQGGEGDRTS